MLNTITAKKFRKFYVTKVSSIILTRLLDNPKRANELHNTIMVAFELVLGLE